MGLFKKIKSLFGRIEEQNALINTPVYNAADKSNSNTIIFASSGFLTDYSKKNQNLKNNFHNTPKTKRPVPKLDDLNPKTIDYEPKLRENKDISTPHKTIIVDPDYISNMPRYSESNIKPIQLKSKDDKLVKPKSRLMYSDFYKQIPPILSKKSTIRAEVVPITTDKNGNIIFKKRVRPIYNVQNAQLKKQPMSNFKKLALTGSLLLGLTFGSYFTQNNLSKTELYSSNKIVSTYSNNNSNLSSNRKSNKEKLNKKTNLFNTTNKLNNDNSNNFKIISKHNPVSQSKIKKQNLDEILFSNKSNSIDKTYIEAKNFSINKPYLNNLKNRLFDKYTNVKQKLKIKTDVKLDSKSLDVVYTILKYNNNYKLNSKSDVKKLLKTDSNIKKLYQVVKTYKDDYQKKLNPYNIKKNDTLNKILYHKGIEIKLNKKTKLGEVAFQIYKSITNKDPNKIYVGDKLYALDSLIKLNELKDTNIIRTSKLNLSQKPFKYLQAIFEKSDNYIKNLIKPLSKFVSKDDDLNITHNNFINNNNNNNNYYNNTNKNNTSKCLSKTKFSTTLDTIYLDPASSKYTALVNKYVTLNKNSKPVYYNPDDFNLF